MRLGAHVGITGGVDRAPAVARDLGCDAMQIFTKNQMQWRVPALAEDSIARFKAGVAEHGIGPNLVHCSYLLNVASSDDALWEKSIDGLATEIQRADALGIEFITFHPGSPKDKGAAWGVKRVAEGVTEALRRAGPGRTMVLLETNAGAGAAVGRTFQELGDIMAGVAAAERKRVGVCLDTCHVFVSGYPIHERAGYDDAFATFDAEVGLEHLKCFHLNDSLGEFDSKRDRHAEIGKGHLGLEPFRWLVNDPRFVNHAGYLETPGGEESYAAEIALLRTLVAR